jgi:hypothetical protein
MLFPDPASRGLPSAAEKKGRETRTYTMYPKKAAHQIPVLEGGASGKPH